MESKPHDLQAYDIVKNVLTDDISEDLKKENANINVDTTMGAMLKIGSEVSKNYYLNVTLNKKWAENHRLGKWHIHDADFANLTVNCLFIPLKKLLENGFNTGQGSIRPPKTIKTAANLSCIILQSSQNDFFGGQAFSSYDFDMGKYVAKSFVRHIVATLKVVYDFMPTNRKLTTIEVDAFTKKLDRFIDKHERILNIEGEEVILKALADLRVHRVTYEQHIRPHAYNALVSEVAQAMEAVVHNLCTMASRAGSQVPFSSLNYGLDTSTEGRLIVDKLLDAISNGLGHGETAIFPISIFKLKKGITSEGCINHDLFLKACAVSAKRLYPNFISIDAPFNLKVYDPERPETHAATMGCRTRVLEDSTGGERHVTSGRGNLFVVTLNLPYLALEVCEELPLVFSNTDSKTDRFFIKLENELKDCMQQLDERFEHICSTRNCQNYPFSIGQELYQDSHKAIIDDDLRTAFMNGTRTIGFIGLAECLVALTGQHHAESEEANELGLRIVKFMYDFVKKQQNKTKINYALMGSPAEGCTGRLARLLREKFGVIKGVTDKEYLTNSHHCPVDYHMCIWDKIDIEAPYHQYENGGGISYIELDVDVTSNVAGFAEIVEYMADSGMGYFSINHPVARDPICGYVGHIPVGEPCPRCGRKEGEGVRADKLIKVQTRATADARYALDASMISVD